MRAWLRAWVVLGCVLLSGTAWSLTPQQARALAVGETEERIAALNAQLAGADEKTVALIQALSDDAVKFTDSAVIVMKDDKGHDPVTGATVAVPATAEDVVNNNQMRSELDSALATIKLFSKDDKVRAEAVKTLQGEPDEAKLPLVEKAYAADGSGNNDVAYFKSVASKLTTPDALLKDYRALTFVTTAYGLGSQVDQTAILRKLMTQDPTSPSSLAQQLSDDNYRKFASALSVWAPPPFSSQSTIDAAIAGFKQHSFETSIGTDSVSLQEATYFSRNAQGITKLSQLMSDKPLLDVVRTALGIPEAFKGLNYDQQVAILQPRVDMSQFATAAGITKFVDKYLAMDQLNQITPGSSGDPVLSLFSNDSSGDPSLTLSAQSLAPRALNLFA